MLAQGEGQGGQQDPEEAPRDDQDPEESEYLERRPEPLPDLPCPLD